MDKRWWLFTSLILFLSLALRLPLLNGSFWLDEAAQALESIRPLSQQLDIVNDFQPPLLHVVVHGATIVTQSEAGLRTVGALVPSLLSILGTMLIARQLLPKKYGLTGSAVTGLLLATNSFHIYFSQELRPYALPMLWAVWSWWWLLRPTKKATNRVVGWIILSLLGLYSSYLYPFLLVGQILFIWFSQPVKQRRIWLAGLLGIIMGFAPWVPKFWLQLQTGQLLRLRMPNWEQAVSTSQIKSLPLVAAKFLFGVVDTDLSVYFIGVGSLIVIVLLWLLFQHQKQFARKDTARLSSNAVLLIFWLLIPPLLAWLASFFVPVIQPKRLLLLLPAFYLLVVQLLVFSQTKAKQFWHPGCFLVLALFVLNLLGTAQYYQNPQLQREDWRGVLQTLSFKYPTANTLSNFSAPFAPIVWYRPQVGGSNITQDRATGTLHIDSSAQAQAIVEEYKRASLSKTLIYFEYLTDLTDPNQLLRTELESSGYQLVELLDYPGIGFVRIYQFIPQYAHRP